MRRILLENVTSDMELARTIHNSEGKVLLAAGQKLQPRYVKKLKEIGIFWVYIEDEKTKDIEVKDVISEQTRVELSWTVRETMRQFKKKKSIIDIGGIKEIINNMIDELTSHKNLVINLSDVRSYDDYVYNHSVGTCILAVVTGIAYKYNQIRIRDLGVGALLHDVGKIKVPIEILNKSGKLTPEEWEVVKKHTIYGYESLKANEELSLLSAHVAYQHHERCDAKGYPRGLPEEQILHYAKITAIADAYDAMTCDRVYRKKFLPHEAMEIIMGLAGTQFNPQLVKLFFQNIAIYPLGTVVELNTGERGVVKKVEKGFTQRPIIKILYNGEGEELKEPFQRNLMEELTVFVTKVIE